MGSQQRANLKDVAALAGTSISTASRAINDSGYVAEETRQRVLEAAQTLNYQPNLKARALRQRTSSSIGLVIPNLLNAYYATLADVFTRKLSEHGYYLLLFSTRDDKDAERAILYDVIGQAVEGLLWAPAATDSDVFDYLEQQHVPTICLVRGGTGDRFDTVVFRDFDGSKTATEHLITLGHRRIGFIGGDMRYSSNAARWEGYIAAHEAAGIAVDETLVKLGTNRDMWGKTAAVELLHLEHPPTALFVGSNALMPGVIRIIRQFNVVLPDELSLLCFDDIDWFAYSNPPISAVRTAPEKLAQVAIDLLLRRINTGSNIGFARAFLEIDFELILRQSVGPPSSR